MMISFSFHPNPKNKKKLKTFSPTFSIFLYYLLRYRYQKLKQTKIIIWS